MTNLSTTKIVHLEAEIDRLEDERDVALRLLDAATDEEEDIAQELLNEIDAQLKPLYAEFTRRHHRRDAHVLAQLETVSIVKYKNDEDWRRGQRKAQRDKWLRQERKHKRAWKQAVEW